jgi:hypothetical protein
VWRSRDQGATRQPAGLQGYTIKALATSRVAPETIYAGTKPAALFASYKGGATWTELAAFRRIPSRRFWGAPAEKPFIGYVQAIALSPSDPQTIVVGMEWGVVVRSRDGGHTWTDHRSGALRDCHSLVFHASNGEWVYEAGGSGAGVALSQSAGERWTQPGGGLDRHSGWAVAADPARPDVWYASLSKSALMGCRSLSTPGPIRCSLIPRLLVRCTPDSAMARSGWGLSMGTPGSTCRLGLGALSGYSSRSDAEWLETLREEASMQAKTRPISIGRAFPVHPCGWWAP